MRNQPHKPTSADIARYAGVSRSTVSRVINGYCNVPEETSRRVREVIDKHGYYPSISGQTLKGKHARCVGVFYGEPGFRAETQAEMLYLFSSSAQAHGYMTLSGNVGVFDTPACDRAVREVLCSGCVDAGVFLNAKGGNRLIRQLLKEGQTIGTIGWRPDADEERLFTVGLDRSIAQKTMEFARSLGHTSAAFLCDCASHVDCAGDYERIQNAAQNTGINLLHPQQDCRHSLNRRAVDVLDSAPNNPLLICADQASVFAAYRAAYARGMAIGKDVSILGMGVLSEDLPLWPALSGFRFDVREIIASLVTQLIRGLEGEADAPRHTQTTYQWMAGESCGHCQP